MQKCRDRNGRCIAILFRSIGVRGRCDSPESGSCRETLSLKNDQKLVLKPPRIPSTTLGVQLFRLQLEASCSAVELFYLQLTILAFLLTAGAFFTYNFSFLLTVGAFLLTMGKCV